MHEPCAWVIHQCRKHDLQIGCIEKANPLAFFNAVGMPVLKVRIELREDLYRKVNEKEWDQIEKYLRPRQRLPKLYTFVTAMKRTNYLSCMLDVVDLQPEVILAVDHLAHVTLIVSPRLVTVELYRESLVVFDGKHNDAYKFIDVLKLDQRAFDKYKFPLRTTSERHVIRMKWSYLAHRLHRQFLASEALAEKWSYLAHKLPKHRV